ncbi:MAG: hypothetical protein GW893_07775 [Armatimonadetes bacterium]|nr:hypothetical protein [Armatimonadota bacterium]
MHSPFTRWHVGIAVRYYSLLAASVKPVTEILTGGREDPDSPRHRRLGNAEAAKAAYEKTVKNFADRPEAAAAKRNLGQ